MDSRPTKMDTAIRIYRPQNCKALRSSFIRAFNNSDGNLAAQRQKQNSSRSLYALRTENISRIHYLQQSRNFFVSRSVQQTVIERQTSVRKMYCSSTVNSNGSSETTHRPITNICRVHCRTKKREREESALDILNPLKPAGKTHLDGIQSFRRSHRHREILSRRRSPL